MIADMMNTKKEVRQILHDELNISVYKNSSEKPLGNNKEKGTFAIMENLAEEQNLPTNVIHHM